MSGHYAKDTSVSVEKSRAELESLLRKYGGTAFAYMSDERQAAVGFRVKVPDGGQLGVRMTLPLPDHTERRFTHQKANQHAPWRVRPADAAYRAWERECRSRWRALVLIVKAKLEACALGISTIEREFMADIVLPNGQTMIEHLGADVRKMLATGDSTIRLALPAGGAA